MYARNISRCIGTYAHHVQLYFLGADSQTLVLILMAFATPLGLNTVVYAASYGADTRTGASMAIISHALSVLTIPLVYALVIMLR